MDDLLGLFPLVDNLDAGIDGTTETDGIDVALGSLGPRFPGGVFIAQDDVNDGASGQNFKLVPWDAVRSVIDTRDDGNR